MVSQDCSFVFFSAISIETRTILCSKKCKVLCHTLMIMPAKSMLDLIGYVKEKVCTFFLRKISKLLHSTIAKVRITPKL